MRLGDLRHLLSIERKTTTRDDDGSILTEWEEVGKAWAQVVPLTGRALEQAQRQEPRVSHRVVMRYRDDLSDKDRFVLKGTRTLNILGFTTLDESNDETIVMCEEVVGA